MISLILSCLRYEGFKTFWRLHILFLILSDLKHCIYWLFDCLTSFRVYIQRSVIKIPSNSTTTATSGKTHGRTSNTSVQTDTTSGQTSSTNRQTSARSRQTSTTSELTGTTSRKTSTASEKMSATNGEKGFASDRTNNTMTQWNYLDYWPLHLSLTMC